MVSPDRPLMLRNGAKLEVHDLIAPVEDFIAHIGDEMRQLAESYSMPDGTFGITSQADAWAVFVAVARARTKQVKHLRIADRMTTIKTAVVMRADGHALAGSVDPVKMSETLELDFHELTFMERPKDRYAAYTEAMRLGLLSPVGMRMLEHPDEDAQTADANARRVIEERNEFAGLLAARNMSADPGADGENLAQLQGRLGGLSRGLNNTDPDGEGDDDGRTADQPERAAG